MAMELYAFAPEPDEELHGHVMLANEREILANMSPAEARKLAIELIERANHAETPADMGESKRWPHHNNDSGKWCPWSGVNGKGERCPADCHESEIMDETRRRYAVGDNDPTPSTGIYGDYCGQLSPSDHVSVCTWPPDHEHPQHVAGDSENVVAAWDA